MSRFSREADDSRFGGFTGETQAENTKRAGRSISQLHQESDAIAEGILRPAEEQFLQAGRQADRQVSGAFNDYRWDRDALNQQQGQARQDLAARESSMLDTHSQNVSGIAGRFTNTAQNLAQQAGSQAAYGNEVYNQTVMPQMMDNLSNANAFYQDVKGSAMSLADMQDPNNQVQQGWRGVYDTQGARGAGMFQDDIQAARQQGLSDFGVLSTLGAQATQGQMAGMPATGAQMQAMQGMNQQQASEAYNAAQRQMRSLQEQARDYELSMQGRGLEAGREESRGAYDRGQSAMAQAAERQASRVADIMAGQGAQTSQQQALRSEQLGAGKDIMATEAAAESTRMSAEDRKFATAAGMSEAQFNQERSRIMEDLGISKELANMLVAGGQRQLGMAGMQAGREMDYANTQAGMALGQMQSAQQQQAAQQAMWGQILGAGIGAAGTVGGAMVGGPVGAAVGGAAGGAIGAGVSGTMAQQQQMPPQQMQMQQQYPVHQGFSPYGPYAGGYRYGY